MAKEEMKPGTETTAAAPEAMPHEHLNIYQRLVRIRATLDAFRKDATTATPDNKKGYAFVSGSQILAKIQPAMNEYRVILKPNLSPECKVATIEYTDRYGNLKDKYEYSGPMTYTWINADRPDDRDVVDWYSTGMQDDPSKSFGSGLTYSERYFLMKYFGIPTDDADPDKTSGMEDKRSGNRKNSDQLVAEAKAKREAAKAAAAAPPPGREGITNSLKLLWAAAEKNTEVWGEAMKTIGVKSKDEINDDNLLAFEAAINELVEAARDAAAAFPE